MERNDPEDVIVKPGFCEPIVTEEEWDKVNFGRRKRQSPSGTGKLLAPLAPAFKIKYMLSGLARCAVCGGSMQPSASKSSAGKWYVYLRCQRTKDGNCSNRTYIDEPWLCEQVIGYIQSRILGLSASACPSPSGHQQVDCRAEIEASSSGVAFEEIKNLVESYLKKKRSNEKDCRPAIKSQIAEIAAQLQGWTLTLGQPNLQHEVRRKIESEFNLAIQSKAELEESLSQLEYVAASKEFHLDSVNFSLRMTRLEEVLGKSNPSLVNVELSLHIDRIDCHPDGTATARFCKLGLAGVDVIDSITALDCLSLPPSEKPDPNPDSTVCRPRKRARLTTDSASDTAWELDSLAHWATDPNRFEYLDDRWFDEVTFVRPKKMSWAEENAIALAECRLNESMTLAALGKKFGKNKDTIRKGLKIAAQQNPKYASLPWRIPRPRWHESHAAEVLAASESMTLKEMTKHFGKSDVTIRKAIKYANESLGPSTGTE